MNMIEINGVWRPTTNSRGRTIASTREGLIAFYAWFKDSYATDRTRHPLVVFHGTRRSFDMFDANAAVTHPWLLGMDNRLGFFFTNNPGTRSDSGLWTGAAGFASTSQQDGETHAAEGAIVLPVYLALDIPYMMTAAQYRACGTRPDLREELEVLGYDGIIVDDGTFVAFHPWQIKSAIGNPGLFSRENPRITDGHTAQIHPCVGVENCPGIFGPVSVTLSKNVQDDLTFPSIPMP